MNYADLYRAIRERTADDGLTGQVSEAMMAIARGSTPITAVRHPLGFRCLPLARQRESGVCVHVWVPGPPEVELTTSPMHSHSWDLLSYVLHGDVRNELVRVSDAPPVPSHRVFEIRSDGDADEIRRTARVVGCARAPGRTAAAGDSYQLAAGQFHMTEVSG
ncbi:MAG TPA: hypothetical protein VFO16_05635, partial [Pseudonocardiaceae bacterium]|nr:hypothetical protein [Pseudonocardiaceae bacterium]